MNKASPFGIPKAARRGLLPHGLVIKTGGRKRDGDRYLPVAYDYFAVGTQPRGINDPLVEHPAFRGKKPQELEIELVDNDITVFYQDWLDCYTGRKPFCSNKRGGDTALRLAPDGTMKPCHCEPETCVFYRANEPETQGAALAELKEHWVKTFSYLGVDKKKGTPLVLDAKCTKNCYFFCHIVDPEDTNRYITNAGMPARLYTQSKHTMENLSMGLLDIYRQYGGQIAGLRCTLKIKFQLNPYGNRVPVVAIEAPMGKGQIEAMALMGRSHRANQVDMRAAVAALGEMLPDEVAAVEWDWIVSEFGAPSTPALPPPNHPATIAPVGPLEYGPYATDDPFAAALLRRLNYSQAAINRFQMDYGSDVDALLLKLRADAEKIGTDIFDLIRRYRPDEAIVEAEVKEIKQEEAPSSPPGFPPTQPGRVAMPPGGPAGDILPIYDETPEPEPDGISEEELKHD